MADTISLSSMSSEGGESIATTEKIEKTFLTCSICFEIYDQPKCLPCLHTFCAECLLSYIESKDMYGVRDDMGFPCPICKQFVSVPDYHKPYPAWLDGIQKNFLIQNMIDCLRPEHEGKRSRSGTIESNEVSEEQDESDPQDEYAADDEEENSMSDVPPSYSPPSPPWTNNASYDPPSSNGRPPWANSPLPVPAPGPQHFHVPVPRSSPSRNMQITAAIGIPPRDLLQNFTSQFGLNQRLEANPLQVDISVPSDPPIRFSESRLLKRAYKMQAKNWTDYKPPRLSDVCCLYKHNGIILLDWENRCVKYVKNIFLNRNVTTAFEVVGRPCSVSVVDKNQESRIVVSLQKRNKLYFLNVPELQMINVMNTRRAYRGITVMSPTTLLAATSWSPGNPAQIDLIHFNYRCDMVSCQTIYQTGKSGANDLYQPNYIASVSDSSFVASDARKNQLFYYEINTVGGKKQAVKKFSCSPPGYRKFKEVGGLSYRRGHVYIVDKESHEVHKVKLGSTIECKCILKASDDVYQPSSVCEGPLGEVCVPSWDGSVTIYK